MKQHSSIKSNWKASVNFWLQISHNKTKSTKNKSFKKSKCNFFKKAKAYLSLRARATEWNFTHNSKSIYLLKSKSKSTCIFKSKSKSKSMCIAHLNPKIRYLIKALYLLNGLHQCWTLTICKKRNLRGWYFQWDLLFLPLEYTIFFHNINCEWANTTTRLNKNVE